MPLKKTQTTLWQKRMKTRQHLLKIATSPWFLDSWIVSLGATRITNWITLQGALWQPLVTNVQDKLLVWFLLEADGNSPKTKVYTPNSAKGHWSGWITIFCQQWFAWNCLVIPMLFLYYSIQVTTCLVKSVTSHATMKLTNLIGGVLIGGLLSWETASEKEFCLEDFRFHQISASWSNKECMWTVWT